MGLLVPGVWVVVVAGFVASAGVVWSGWRGLWLLCVLAAGAHVAVDVAGASMVPGTIWSAVSSAASPGFASTAADEAAGRGPGSAPWTVCPCLSVLRARKKPFGSHLLNGRKLGQPGGRYHVIIEQSHCAPSPLAWSLSVYGQSMPTLFPSAAALALAFAAAALELSFPIDPRRHRRQCCTPVPWLARCPGMVA